YNCRQMRTSSGTATRMSTHATADSIDISGVTLSDGRSLRLINGWPAADARAPFFRDLRDSACMWFRVTLGPDYNRLHADHFHLQHTGWGLCR
ncbi:MAG: extensin family protein, partial [Pseudomonadota bacterium]